MDPAPGAAGPDGEMDEALRALAKLRRRRDRRLRTIGAWWPVAAFSAGRLILCHLAATIGEPE